MIVQLLILGFIFASFCGSLASSIAILVLTWNTKARLQTNVQICLLSIVLGAGLWVAMLALLFEPLVQRPTEAGLLKLFIYAILAGATPMTAFPGIYLFGGKGIRPR